MKKDYHITISEYCQLYECSRKTYYNRIKSGIIPAKAITTIQGKIFLDKRKLT